MVADMEGHLATSASMGRLALADAGNDVGEGLNRSGCNQERERQKLGSSRVMQSGAVVERIGITLSSSRKRAV